MSDTAASNLATAEVEVIEPKGTLSPADLEPLMRAFNEVTARLSTAHESLSAQVVRLKQELSEANRQVQRSKHLAMLGEMAAGIAHEVRNPLGSIMLYARQMEQDLGDRPEQKQTAGKIASAVGKLDLIVRDVLAFSRETRIRTTSVSVAELFEAAVEAARNDSAMWRGVQVVGPTAAAGAIEVICDPTMLHQALVNVIRNAVEIMHESGASTERTITIDARRQEVMDSLGKARPMVVLSVRDSGPGISEVDAARVFTPFFTTRATGTGLGLAIVHRIIDAHGGRVSIGNVVGDATTRPASERRATKTATKMATKAPATGAVVEIMLPVQGLEPAAA